jgi:hypothetical protein
MHTRSRGRGGEAVRHSLPSDGSFGKLHSYLAGARELTGDEMCALPCHDSRARHGRSLPNVKRGVEWMQHDAVRGGVMLSPDMGAGE